VSDVVAGIASGLEGLVARLEAGPELAEAVAHEAGLDPDPCRRWLIEWARSIDAASMGRLLASATRPVSQSNVLTVAPGNIPIIGAECLIVGLLAEVDHSVALSSRGAALATALFSELDDAVRERAHLAIWRQLSPRDQAIRLERADRLVVYGEAGTVEWIASQAQPKTVIVPHGPSFSAGFLDPHAEGWGTCSEALRGLADDLSRFEQRGCRSPHLLFVRGDPGDLRRICDELSDGVLPAAQLKTPRGPLTDAEVAARFLDRLTSEALGEVIDGEGWQLTVEVNPWVVRASPLGRTLRVVGIDHSEALVPLLSTLPAPTRLICVASDSLDPIDGIEQVPFGRLQRPPFDRRHDGSHRIDELRSGGKGR
jgi:hypothetical protein